MMRCGLHCRACAYAMSRASGRVVASGEVSVNGNPENPKVDIVWRRRESCPEDG